MLKTVEMTPTQAVEANNMAAELLELINPIVVDWCRGKNPQLAVSAGASALVSAYAVVVAVNCSELMYKPAKFIFTTTAEGIPDAARQIIERSRAAAEENPKTKEKRPQ